MSGLGPAVIELRSSKSLRMGLFIAISVSVAAIVIIMYLTMDRDTWKKVAEISPLFVLIALGLVLGRWIMTIIRAQLLIQACGTRLSFGKTTKAVLAGGFAGAVTPFHAAGIPTEIYFMYKYGLTGAQATAVVTTGAAMSILLFVISIPIVFGLASARIDVSVGYRTLLVAAGIIGFFFFLMVAYSMKEPESATEISRRLTPSFIRKRPGYEKKLERFSKAIAEFSDSLQTIFSYRRSVLIAIILLTVGFWGTGFLVTPVIVWGLGYQDLFWKALLAQLVVSMLLPFMPVPGESGMAEATFSGIFIVFIPTNLIAFVTLAWRFFMFYLPLLFCGIGLILALRDVGKTFREFDAGDLAEDIPAV